MRAEKMRGIDATDLQRQANDAQEQLFRFRFQLGMGQAEGLKKYRALKKDRARMLTILHEKAGKGELPEAQPVKKAAPVKAGKTVKKATAKSGADKKSKK